MDKLKISSADAPFIEALRELIRTGVMAAPGLESSPLINLAVVCRQSGKARLHVHKNTTTDYPATAGRQRS